jgi:hypothetical protein
MPGIIAEKLRSVAIICESPRRVKLELTAPSRSSELKSADRLVGWQLRNRLAALTCQLKVTQCPLQRTRNAN